VVMLASVALAAQLTEVGRSCRLASLTGQRLVVEDSTDGAIAPDAIATEHAPASVTQSSSRRRRGSAIQAAETRRG